MIVPVPIRVAGNTLTHWSLPKKYVAFYNALMTLTLYLFLMNRNCGRLLSLITSNYTVRVLTLLKNILENFLNSNFYLLIYCFVLTKIATSTNLNT